MLEFDFRGKFYEISMEDYELREVLTKYYYKNIFGSVSNEVDKRRLEIYRGYQNKIAEITIYQLLEEIAENGAFRNYEDFIRRMGLFEVDEFLDVLLTYYDNERCEEEI